MKEIWKQGKNGGCIVSNVKPERHYTEEDYQSEKEYYGGYLIAESIPDMVKLNILAASLDMLDALENLENDDNSIPDHAWLMVEDAIKKAHGKL